MRTLLPFMLFAIALTARTEAQTPRSSGEQSVLTPGDSVRIVVWRRPEFSGDFAVAADGSVTHPLYRAVRVAGVPYATAEANIRTFLSKFEENPQFVMEPLVRVAVSGEVTKPIVAGVRPETTIGEAIARAGGVNQNGASNRVRVLRLLPNGEQRRFTVNLADASGSTGSTQPVRSGDQIVVDRRKSFFRDILIPGITIVGSIASFGLLIDRINRK